MLEENELLNGQLLSENNSDADIFGEDVLTGKLIANGDVVASMIAEKGAKGDAATIAVGTTTTGDPGTQAIVTNSGTSSDAVFNFTIPKGEKGDTGNTGAAATIAVGTVTTGDAGTSATITNSGTSSAAVFDFTIPKGDKGDTGNTGTAATISIGTVTTGQPGSDATVTNSGTTSAAVFDFSIPRGYDGQGAGDMLKSVYDTDDNGIVDNAEKVNNHTVDKDVPSTAVFTDENAVWGNITGTLSNQTDLKSALDKKPDLTPTRLTDTNIGTSSNPYILDTMASGYYFIETPSGSSTRYFKLTNSASGSTSISSSASGDGFGFYLYIPEIIDTPNLSNGDVVCYFDRISVSSDGYTSGGLICYVYDSTKSSKITLNNLKSYNRSFGKTVTGSAQTWSGIKTFNSVPVCATAPTNNSDLANKKYVDDSIPTNVSELTNDSNFISTSNTAGLIKNDGTIDTTSYSTFSGDYGDLTNKPTIPDSTSDLNNDSGFITDTVETMTCTKNIAIPKNSTAGYGLTNSSGNSIIRDFNNTNVTVDATGGDLFLGYANTGSLNFLNGKSTIESTGAVKATNGIYSVVAGSVGTNSNKAGMLMIKRATSSEAPNNGVVLEYATNANYAGQLYIGDNSTQGCYFNGWSNGTRGSWRKLAFEDNTDRYSTTETRIGTWTDNRTLYRKVVHINALPNNTSTAYNLNLSNVRDVIKIYGTARGSTGNAFPLPYIDKFSGSNHNIELTYLSSSTQVRISTSNDRSGLSADIIVEYTKTS